MDMEMTYICGSCGKGYKKSDHLKKHLLIHNGSRPFQCSSCGKAFREKTHLTAHLLLHTGEKPYKCSHCGRAFNQNSNLKKHIKIHLDDRPYVCNICKNRFTHQCYLNEHMKNHTGERAYECTDCGKKFKNSSHLRSHRKTHSDERPYKCNLCDKTFKYIRNYSLHKMGHGGDPSCNCSECGRQFLNRNSLNIHMLSHSNVKILSHSNVKIYECFVCGEEFKKLDKFKRHLQAHTGERPFKCSICDDGFKSSSHLKFHMMLHTGEKPFTCEVCGSGFRSKSYLTSHMVSHNKTRHRCTVCSKSFKYKCNYTRHVKTHGETEMQQSLMHISTDMQQNSSDLEKVIIQTIKPSYSSSLSPSGKVALVAQGTGGTNTKGTSVISEGEKIGEDQKVTLVSYSSEVSENFNSTRNYKTSSVRDSKDNLGNEENSLKMVMRSCTDDYPFHCTHCKETFQQESQLEEHLKFHIPGSAYFRDNDYLQIHVPSHEVESDKSLMVVNTEGENCKVCGVKFTRKHLLRQHMHIHLDQGSFECSVCQKKFNDESELKTHILLHSSQKTYECSVCNKKSLQSSDLKRHMRIHCAKGEMEDKPYSCSICELRFCYKHNLDTHKMIHVMRENALKHQRQDIVSNGYTTDTTDNTMSDKSIIHTLMEQYFISSSVSELDSEEVVTHIIDEQEMDRKGNQVIFQENREYELTKVTIPTAFENYIESNSTPEQNFLCIICGEDCIEPSLLKSHLRQHKLECPQCGKAFNRLNNLKRHMVIHTGMRRYECYVCAKKFKESGHLKTHFLHVHSEEQSIECKFCSKKFSHKSYYQRHLKIHHGDKETIKTHLNIHVRKESTRNNEYLQKALENIESDVKFNTKDMGNIDKSEDPKCEGFSASSDGDESSTHKSSQCMKGFSKRSNLKRHIMIHTNECAYDCPLCGKRFKEKKCRDEHKMEHTGARPHHCTICDRKFTQKSLLNRHRKTHVTLDLKGDVEEGGETNLERDGNLGGSGMDGRMKSVRIPQGDIEVTQEILCDITEPTVEIQVGKLKIQTISYEAAMKRRQILKERRLHKCAVCNKLFNRKSNLARHVLCHKDSNVLNCNYCSSTFKSKQLLESHMLIHGREPANQPDSHRKTANENEPHGYLGTQDVSNSEDPSVQGDVIHIKSLLSKKSLSCSICGMKFHFQHHLENHLIIHKLKKKIGHEKIDPSKIDHEKGDLPKIVIKSRGSKTGMDDGRSKPDLDYENGCQEQVEDHGESKIIIVKEQSFSKDERDEGEMEVGKITVKTLPYSLARERRLKERGNKKRVNCSVCGKDFASSYSLKGHMKLHTRGRWHNCKYCGEKFHTHNSLENHINELHRGSIVHESNN
ncbi:zinc finger protein 91-like [Macrobrachium nipponense]|uniref:zinc finger protein 91-like n=1 Tax=Macrobrachium nipponense TaxID=159736 RepID=UPI0030C7D3B0